MRHDGKTSAGKAQLEASEVLFRGETRLKIPFSSIQHVQAKNGQLHLRTADGLAIFELGPQAEKWCHKITHPKSVIEKLGVKPGDAVVLEGKFPAQFGVDLKKRGATIVKAKSDASPWIFLATQSPEDLRCVQPIAQSMKDATALWIVYPKGQKTITESDVRSAGLKLGLTDIKVVSFSPTHTALKFVVPSKKRQNKKR